MISQWRDRLWSAAETVLGTGQEMHKTWLKFLLESKPYKQSCWKRTLDSLLLLFVLSLSFLIFQKQFILSSLSWCTAIQIYLLFWSWCVKSERRLADELRPISQALDTYFANLKTRGEIRYTKHSISWRNAYHPPPSMSKFWTLVLRSDGVVAVFLKLRK